MYGIKTKQMTIFRRKLIHGQKVWEAFFPFFTLPGADLQKSMLN